jgi:hypothetical protein
MVMSTCPNRSSRRVQGRGVRALEKGPTGARKLGALGGEEPSKLQKARRLWVKIELGC